MTGRPPIFDASQSTGTASADDPRWRLLARLIVTWSTHVEKGDRVLISAGEPGSLLLASLVNAEIVRAGGHPQIVFGSDHLESDMLRYGSTSQARWVPGLERLAMRWADVAIVLRGGDLIHEDGALDPARVAARRAALGQISASRTSRTRWVIVRLPTSGVARQAGRSLQELTEDFFAATLRDWAHEREQAVRVASRLADMQEIHIRGRGTDLRMSVADRTWLIEDGHINLPGGEIATSPREDSAEGEISFEHPAIFAGHVFTGITLVFRRGRVVQAHAERNGALLTELLGIDDGARRIGEVGFGMNHGLRQLHGDLLYDEKVAGTFHLALGRSYAACGGTNSSDLHWDIVKDFRDQGTVTIDDRVVLGPDGLLEWQSP